jgi:hypothetical protein
MMGVSIAATLQQAIKTIGENPNLSKKIGHFLPDREANVKRRSLVREPARHPS